jgi:hypothetical protein
VSLSVLSSAMSSASMGLNVLVVPVLQSQDCGINRFAIASQNVSLARLRVLRVSDMLLTFFLW